jgi:hypothetical protein
VSHPTRAFRALDYVLSLTVEGDASLRAYTETLLRAFPPSDEAPRPWEIRPAEVGGTDSWELVVDGEREATVGSASRLVHDLVRALNARAVQSWPGVACHAGGVVRDGVGVVLPADTEAGKTTLTAGLVRAGFGYLTDEAVAFRRGTATIEPYPKPLSIDPGSWSLFPELEPHADLGDDDYKKTQWQVPPDAIRIDAAASACAARLLVFPRYVQDAPTELNPLGRAEALVELAKNTFSFNTNSRAALDALAIVVRVVDCYRLTVGTLADGVAAVTALVEDVAAGGGDG